MSLVYQHAVGERFAVTLPFTEEELEGATIRSVLRKPDGSTLVRAVEVTSNLATYDTVRGELDQVGRYLWQVEVVLESGRTLKTDPVELDVWSLARQGS